MKEHILMAFRKGDKVTVTATGKTGTVKSDGSKSGGLIAVKGTGNKIVEAVKGYPGHYADELQKND